MIMSFLQFVHDWMVLLRDVVRVLDQLLDEDSDHDNNEHDRAHENNGEIGAKIEDDRRATAT